MEDLTAIKNISSNVEQGDRPLISVIIPVYNREKVVERAIKSVLSQSCQNFEIIVADDASIDGTRDVVEAMATDDDRIIYLKHEINKGAQAARNTGAKASRGEWITFLDSDDYLTPKSLESRFNLAKSQVVQVVHSECLVLREGSDLCLFGVPKVNGSVYKFLLSSPGPIVFPGLLISKEAFEKIGYLDEDIKAYQEWDTVIRLAKYFDFAFLDEPSFVYDCRGGDTISKNILSSAEGYKQIFDKHFDEIFHYLGLKAVAGHYKNTALRFKAAGKLGKAAYYRFLSLIFWPSKFMKSKDQGDAIIVH